MLIRLYKKILLICLTGMLSVSTADAFTIGGGTKGLTKNVQNLVNEYTEKGSSLLSQYFSEFLGSMNVNLKCLVPNLDYNKYFSKNIKLCDNVKSFYSFKLGPCVVTVNLSNNPLYSRLNNLCNAVNGVADIHVVFNGTLGGIAVEEGFKKMDSSGKNDDSKIIFPSSLSYQDIYGDLSGKIKGYFASMATEHPNSSDAKAWLNDDKEALLVKENLLKSGGEINGKISPSTGFYSAVLPKNDAQARKMIRDNAKIYKQAEVNYVDLISAVQIKLKNYIVNHMDNFNESDFFNYFKDYVDGKTTDENGNPDLTIIKTYKTLDDAINYKYANKLLILEAKSPFFEYSPTETKFKTLPLEKRKKFLYNSMIWNAQKTDLLGQREEERQRKHNEIRVVLRKAYIAAIPFNRKKAEEELDDLLK